MGKNKTKKSTKSGEALRKETLAVTEGNIARIDAQERGEAPAAEAKNSGRRPWKSKGGKVAKPPKQKKPRKLSGLDAAAKVLMESKEPLAAQDIVKAMSENGYWKSPGGKTPHATIYAAMAREISEKGKASRFKKVDRGLFAANK